MPHRHLYYWLRYTTATARNTKCASVKAQRFYYYYSISWSIRIIIDISFWFDILIFVEGIRAELNIISLIVAPFQPCHALNKYSTVMNIIGATEAAAPISPNTQTINAKTVKKVMRWSRYVWHHRATGHRNSLTLTPLPIILLYLILFRCFHRRHYNYIMILIS